MKTIKSLRSVSEVVVPQRHTSQSPRLLVVEMMEELIAKNEFSFFFLQCAVKLSSFCCMSEQIGKKMSGPIKHLLITKEYLVML